MRAAHLKQLHEAAQLLRLTNRLRLTRRHRRVLLLRPVSRCQSISVTVSQFTVHLKQAVPSPRLERARLRLQSLGKEGGGRPRQWRSIHLIMVMLHEAGEARTCSCDSCSSVASRRACTSHAPCSVGASTSSCRRARSVCAASNCDCTVRSCSASVAASAAVASHCQESESPPRQPISAGRRRWCPAC